ncbi:MAG: FadR/GntR family transcriptional regulator [Bacteroidota bacterium]
MENILEKIKPVSVQKPSEIVLRQIKVIIGSGELKPGDKLPPERALAERFGVGRGHIREAIKKLEFYGIVSIHPQSGTKVANLGINLISGLISNILQLEKDDFKSLLETRSVLEVEATRLTAERIDNAKLEKLNLAHDTYIKKVKDGGNGIEEDLLFHLQIAELSGNPVLHSILSFITPEVVNLSKKMNTCKNERPQDALIEHNAIFHAIQSGESEKAANAMKEHMSNTIRMIM